MYIYRIANYEKWARNISVQNGSPSEIERFTSWSFVRLKSRSNVRIICNSTNYVRWILHDEFDFEKQDLADAAQRCNQRAIVHGLVGNFDRQHATIYACSWESNLCFNFLRLKNYEEI